MLCIYVPLSNVGLRATLISSWNVTPYTNRESFVVFVHINTHTQQKKKTQNLCCIVCALFCIVSFVLVRCFFFCLHLVVHYFFFFLVAVFVLCSAIFIFIQFHIERIATTMNELISSRMKWKCKHMCIVARVPQRNNDIRRPSSTTLFCVAQTNHRENLFFFSTAMH